MKYINTFFLIVLSTVILNAQQVQMQIIGATMKVSEDVKMEVDGNFQLFSTAQIDNDGLIEIEGFFYHGGSSEGFINRNDKGELLLKRTTSPTIIFGNVPIYFEKLTLDNPFGIQNNVDVFIENKLEFLNGKLFSEDHFVTILNDSGDAIMGANNDRYLAGKIRQYVVNGNTYHFPLGSITNYQPATLNIQNIGNSNFIEAEFFNESVISPELFLNGISFNTFLDSGFWQFKNPTEEEALFNISVTSNGHTNGGNIAEEHALFRRVNGSWGNAGTHDNATQSGSLNEAITAQRTDVQGLGDFIIGHSGNVVLTNTVLHDKFKFEHAIQSGSSLTIQFEGKENIEYQIHLIDLLGRVLETKIVDDFSNTKAVNLELGNLNTNIYFIAISSEEFLFSKKVLLVFD